MSSGFDDDDDDDDDDGVRARGFETTPNTKAQTKKRVLLLPVISGQQEAPEVAIPAFASLPHRLDANHRAGERERGYDDRGQVMKRRLSIGIVPHHHRASNFPATTTIPVLNKVVFVLREERRPFLASMVRHATTHDGR